MRHTREDPAESTCDASKQAFGFGRQQVDPSILNAQMVRYVVVIDGGYCLVIVASCFNRGGYKI